MKTYILQIVLDSLGLDYKLDMYVLYAICLSSAWEAWLGIYQIPSFWCPIIQEVLLFLQQHHTPDCLSITGGCLTHRLLVL